MPKSRGVLACLAGIAAAIVLLICIGYDLDKDARYATYSEAEADGAITRGWLPDFVPASATEIRESHNLDVNTQWLTFHFAPEDLPVMLESLTSVGLDELRFHRPGASAQRPWWPVVLLRRSDALTERFDLYRYRGTIQLGSGSAGETAYVAIEKDKPVLWYWDAR